MTAETSKEEVMDRLEREARYYTKISRDCAQSTLLPLQDQFGLGDSATLKAATPFPGIALRGETCGAVIGALMALGMVYGRDRDGMEDINQFHKAIRPARRFCRRFEEKFGSTMCRDIQKLLFGRSFNVADPAEGEEFAKAGSGERCGDVTGTAVRIAAEIIMAEEK